MKKKFNSFHSHVRSIRNPESNQTETDETVMYSIRKNGLKSAVIMSEPVMPERVSRRHTSDKRQPVMPESVSRRFTNDKRKPTSRGSRNSETSSARSKNISGHYSTGNVGRLIAKYESGSKGLSANYGL